jgi:chromosome segregation and condensation protein ScpB
MEYNPQQHIEYILMTHGGAISKKKLKDLVFNRCKLDNREMNQELFDHIISTFQESLQVEGKKLLITQSSIAITYNDEVNEFYGLIDQQDIKPLSQSQAEVLTCIAYGEKISKGEIDSIRGIDSRASLHELIKRGYVTYQSSNKHYSLTPEAFSSLGISQESELPDFETIRKELFYLYSD